MTKKSREEEEKGERYCFKGYFQHSVALSTTQLGG